MKKINSFLLYSNINKDPDLSVSKSLLAYIESKKGTAVIVSNEDDFDGNDKVKEERIRGMEAVIVFGGDGTMLRELHTVSDRSLPVIGINLGTMGFLTEVEQSAMYDAVDRLMEGEYTIESRMLLKGRIIRAESYQQDTLNDMIPLKPFTEDTGWINALNDIVVIREGVLRLIALKIYLNGKLFDTYEADGLIVSTPTGSTGYNLSCGGPIVSPKARVTLLTAVSPHSMSKKSLVFDASDHIRIELIEKRKTQKNEAIVSYDGYANYEMSVGDAVEVSASNEVFLLIRLQDTNFFETLGKKIED